MIPARYCLCPLKSLPSIKLLDSCGVWSIHLWECPSIQALTIWVVILELRFHPRRLESSPHRFHPSPDFNVEVGEGTSQVAEGSGNVFAMRNLHPFFRAILAERNNHTKILNMFCCDLQSKRSEGFGARVPNGAQSLECFPDGSCFILVEGHWSLWQSLISRDAQLLSLCHPFNQTWFGSSYLSYLTV